MMKALNQTALIGALLALFLAMPAHANMNKSVKVGAGESSDGESTVNGSVTIGEGATVTGGISTVNGSIRIRGGAAIRDAETVNGGLRVDENVKSQDLSTVNGTIRVANDVTVDGRVSTVNGKIEVGGGSKVSHNLGNVNGSIELEGSTVGGNVSTVSGDIELADGAVVEGDLIVEKPGGWGWNKESDIPRIVIGPGSRVEGTIRLEREVKLYISESAEVGGVEGEMTMDDAVRFRGKRP
jgi:hypothetical protein